MHVRTCVFVYVAKVYSLSTGAHYPGLKRPELEPGYTPYTAEVKKEWRTASLLVYAFMANTGAASIHFSDTLFVVWLCVIVIPVTCSVIIIVTGVINPLAPEFSFKF
jgi:hypothetical protein